MTTRLNIHRLNQKNKNFILPFFLIYFMFTAFVFSQDVIGENGMVAAAHTLASKAGVQILQEGGNAIDALVASTFVLGVVEPNASGIGGGGFMTIKMSSKKKGVTIDFRETAPAKATSDFYYLHEKEFGVLVHAGALSVGVPGTVAGLTLALEKYGTMNLEQVLKPAIKYAAEGFEVSQKLSNMITEAYDVISKNDASSAIYLNEGLPRMEGEIITNPDLANTLSKIAKDGADAFYRNEIANTISSEMIKQNGLLSKYDLVNYKAQIKEPVVGEYKNYQILSSAPPSGGGTHIVEYLNILENYNLKEMKHNSVEYIHLLSEAMKIVMADKAANMVDPDFYSVPVGILTSQEYADGVRKHIKLDEARYDYKTEALEDWESNSTTHMSVVDKDGNLVALTQSINHWFGSGVTVEGTGILLNNHLGDFSRKPNKINSISPNKRPVSSIAPTIVLKDGKPFLTIGTPGGSRIIGALSQILLNIIEFDMGIDDAIEAPRIHTARGTLHVEGRIDNEVISKLEKLGHKIKTHPEYDNYFGGAQGIIIKQDSKIIIGGADSRRDGVAVGY